MPPPSKSRDLVPTGSKEVHRQAGGKSVQTYHGHRKDRDLKPTTERALILRNGKYVARGSGELARVMSKLTGRDKLDLLAEDLIEKASKALSTPFRTEFAIKLAESQLGENLDEIATLKDADLFLSTIEQEIKFHTSIEQKGRTEPLKNPVYVAQVVSDRIHNTYLLASAWKIVVDTLYSLQQCDMTGDSVISILIKDEHLRSEYLGLYDLVCTLVDLSQRQFSLLATSTPHYACYFKEVTDEKGDQGYLFDWQETRRACSSFLDSIIIELCFPRAPYPKAILYQILHDAIEESPREARRFPQALWDAVGDLSVAVQLHQMIEMPLLSPDGRKWKTDSPNMPESYRRWTDAQLRSEIASEKYATFQDVIFPLQRTKTKAILDLMWTTINANYKRYSGKSIDSLWDLSEILNQPSPGWHSYGHRTGASNGHGPSGTTVNSNNNKKPLAITNGGETDDEIPPLQDVSDSDSEEEAEWSDSDSDGGELGDGSEDDESQEDELRALVHEAMKAASAVNWNEPVEYTPGLDPFTADDRKGNPFLNLLGSLRGRMFSKSTKLKTATGSKLPSRSSTLTSAAADASNGVTVEEVTDEEDVTSHPNKRKKKPKKKKKPQKPAVVATVTTASPAPGSPAPAPEIKVETKVKTSAVKSNAVPAASQSTASFFPLESVTTAQSARSYIHSEQLDAPKTKVKTRSAHSSIFSATRGLFEKFGVAKEKKTDTSSDKKERRAWFANLSKKTRQYVQQILHTADDETKGAAGMKWDTFVKVLTDLGFSYDPTTAGSSVRFDPPDPRDRSISFHRPHPDSTIDPIKLKIFSKKLRMYYGWEPADLMSS
ncbi:hypothetical protein D9757_004247 [Collybiopsis confluens]|uniref:Uncharacterized protein n=1 Tax=Collybiopsis confluens TaxID=2823264 RepID=A0A8H5HTN3_9AGAR|nr:hypothetical protein D9757_004247 [Collybiopsis confluens]